MNQSLADHHLPEPMRADLTDRWSSEEIRLALTAFDASLNSIVYMTAIRDSNNQIIDFWIRAANRAVEQSLYRKPEEIVGTRLLETFPGNIESGLFTMYVRVTDSGKSEQAIQYYTDVNGLDAWFDVSAVRQDIDSIVLTFMNVTAAKKNEQLLIQQTDLLQTVLNNAQAAISMHEAIRNEVGQIENFRTILANQRALTMWGDLAESIMTKTFEEVALPDQKVNDFPKYVRVVETGEPDITEFTIGDQWWLRITTKSGDGVVIANVDVSESRRYQQQLEVANLELKRSNESLRSFAYIASHDLQEPLRKIQSFGTILQERYALLLGDEGNDLVNRMQAASERMSLLIRDLLDYSKISSQQSVFRPFSLTKLIDDIIEDLRHSIHETGARIVIGTDGQAELPDIIGDRFLLRQLFQNLLANALKFHQVDETGVPIPPLITISAQLAEPGSLPPDILDIRPDRSYWAISVADNGIGFDQQYAEQIFQVFQRLHTRSQFSGTGIGLAVVKKIIEQHGGTVRVRSAIGAGAEFTVYLPT